MDKKKNGYRWHNLSPEQRYWFRGLWIDTGTSYEEWATLIHHINSDMTSEDVMHGMETHDITDQDYNRAINALIEIINGRN